MHKKLEAELVSLAHSILKMKNKDDINALHQKSLAIYEKLSVLKFVENYVQTTPNLEETKEEIVESIEKVQANDSTEKEEFTTSSKAEETPEQVDLIEQIDEIEEVEEIEQVEEKVMLTEEQVEEIFSEPDPMKKDELRNLGLFQTSFDEELKDAISADVATNMFEKATKENPVAEEVKEEKSKSLNDSLFKNNLQIGLNDRIAFVKHLFDGSQEDFNRVISQLNSFNSEKEAKNFLNKLVKPDYNWEEKEEFEERLIGLIERKFM
jgi:hypothetical protein